MPGDVEYLKDIFVRRGRELAEAQRQKMAGEGTFVGEKFGCALNGEGPAPSVDVAFARLVTKWTRVAVTVATRDVLDFAASWGRGLLDAGAPQFVVAAYDEDAAATLTKALCAERVARVAAGTTLAALARAAHDLGKDVLATVPEIASANPLENGTTGSYSCTGVDLRCLLLVSGDAAPAGRCKCR